MGSKKKEAYKYNGILKKRSICANLGWQNYELEINKMYQQNKMSGIEIAEYINQNTPNYLNITPRSIQRVITNPRNIKEAFNNAIRRGRVNWVYKNLKIKRKKLSPKLRYEILKRDKFSCVLCGATAKDDLLEVDHITPLCRGGLSTLENLRTLCYQCNHGKQIAEKEI